MVQQLIITGTADKGNGDPLRTAFTKVNNNFTELFNHVSAGVVAGATAPTDPGEGDLWWDSESGRLYVYYGTAWVDASPVDGAGISSTNELVNGAHTVSLSSVGLTAFPAISNESLFIQASELGSANASIGISAKNNVIVTANILDTAKQWTFGTEGKLTLPAGTTYEYLAAPLTGHGDGLARLDFTLMTDGVGTSWLAASADPAGSGYSEGDTFTFDEDFLGIPGASVTIEVLTVGEGGSVEDLSFSLPPLYPADIYRDSPINLQVGDESNRWTFGATGTLTLPGDLHVGNSSIREDGLFSQQFSIAAGAGSHVEISSNDGEKVWSFDTTGTLTLPNGGVVNETATNIAVALDQFTAGGFDESHVFFKTSDTLYESPAGPTMELVSGIWRLKIGPSTYYDSTDLITWSPVAGGLPAPVGTLDTIETINLTVSDKTWGFDTRGGLTTPDGSIGHDGNGNIVLASDSLKSVKLWSGNGLYSWEFDATSTLTTPGDIQLGADSYLRFSDSSFQGTAFVGDATRLYGNVDEDVEVTVRHRPAVSAVCSIAVGDEFVADTETNDDITVVQVGWTVDVGGTEYTVTSIDPAPPAWQYRITAAGATFVQGTEYTFTNPTATLQTWTFNNETGTLIAPGGAILSSESITEGLLTDRNFSIELPNEDGTNEYRWAFDNNGTLTLPVYNPVANTPNIQIGTSTRIVDTESGFGIPAGISGGTVYTSSFTDLASMKLLVTIEGEEDTGDGWPHTQVCEMMVVRRDADGIITVNSSVYGVVYTGSGPLATLTAITSTDGRVDIIAEATNEENITVKVHAIEVFRNQ